MREFYLFVIIGALTIAVIVLIIQLVKQSKRNHILEAALAVCAQDAEQYQKAILYKAHSYYRVNLSRNVLIPPVIERELGEFCDLSSVTTYQYDLLISERAEKIIAADFRDDFIYFCSPSNLLKCYSEGKTNPSFTCQCHTPQLGYHTRKFVCYLSADENTGDIMSIHVAYEY